MVRDTQSDMQTRREDYGPVKNAMRRLFNTVLVALLSTSLSFAAQPVPQSSQEPVQTQPPTGDDARQPQPVNPNNGTSATPAGNELPDAPTPAEPVQQKQGDSSGQTQTPSNVPTGAAGAKAAPAKGAPASRPVGSAIAPAKQRERRSLLIKMGLVAGACIAVGSVVALSKGSPSRPPGAQ
jgi:hypothetical protein